MKNPVVMGYLPMYLSTYMLYMRSCVSVFVFYISVFFSIMRCPIHAREALLSLVMSHVDIGSVS